MKMKNEWRAQEEKRKINRDISKYTDLMERFRVFREFEG
jgi:hypothetical protein